MNVSKPLNNPYDATVKGLELDFQHNFWYLPGTLSNIVFGVNYARIFSEYKQPFYIRNVYFEGSGRDAVQVVELIDSSFTSRLVNQPKHVLNTYLGYDYKGFSGRLSMLYNDDVFVSTNFWPSLRQNTDAYRRWDLSMKQKLPYEGLELFLNINNLTETSDVSRFRGLTSSGDNLQLEQYYGRTMDLGFRYAF